MRSGAEQVDPGTQVSVVVATYRRAERLPRLLAALAAQTHQPAELVLVDDCSGVPLPELTAPFPVRVIRRDRNGGPAAARQDGVDSVDGASSTWIAFTDDDCVPRPDWLQALLRYVLDSQVEPGAAARTQRAPREVVVGRTVAAPDQEHLRGVFSRTVETVDASRAQTCNVLYPKALLTELGGFDLALRTGEDTDLALRATEAGATVLFASDAVVEHDVRASSLPRALAEAWSWHDLPGVIARHPQVRDVLHRRVFWKPTHPPALLALAGLLLARRRPWALLLVGPWARHRLSDYVPVSPRRRVVSLPGQLAVDLVEVAAMARGSVEHRALVL